PGNRGLPQGARCIGSERGRGVTMRTHTEHGTARRAAGARRALMAGVLLATAVGAGCRQDMHDTPRYEAFEESDFFADKRAMRPFVEGTVARGMLHDNDLFYTGLVGEGELTPSLPPEVVVDRA